MAKSKPVPEDPVAPHADPDPDPQAEKPDPGTSLMTAPPGACSYCDARRAYFKDRMSKSRQSRKANRAQPPQEAGV